MRRADASIQFGAGRLLRAIRAGLVRRHAQAEPHPGPETGARAQFDLGLTSRDGEDGVIAELLRRIDSGGRWFVEVGAPQGGSDGRFLADALGWSGTFIDADDAVAVELAERHCAMTGVAVIHGEVALENVDALLRPADVPWEPDVFSINSGGNEFWIWDTLSACLPRIVVVACNARLGPSLCLVQPYDATAQADPGCVGASVGALERLAARLGCTLAHIDGHGVHAFFVRDDLLPRLIPSTSAASPAAARTAPAIRPATRTTKPAPPGSTSKPSFSSPASGRTPSDAAPAGSPPPGSQKRRE